jgi:hypothetical protein
MDREIYCPFCNKEFDGVEWEDGHCPGCDRSYWWEEIYDYERGDSFVEIQWDWAKIL